MLANCKSNFIAIIRHLYINCTRSPLCKLFRVWKEARAFRKPKLQSMRTGQQLNNQGPLRPYRSFLKSFLNPASPVGFTDNLLLSCIKSISLISSRFKHQTYFNGFFWLEFCDHKVVERK